ncbi:MAG: UDP-N-acetylglucosamine 1-carboxyvinyltransferase [Bacillota bacterium]
MDRIIINGGHRLAGRVSVEGAKNAVLPIIAASLLGGGLSMLKGIPPLQDVYTMSEVLSRLGLQVRLNGEGEVRVDASVVPAAEAPYDLVRKMRASVLVMGPLLARLGRAVVPLPGGCAIGTRPIDLHLKGFEALGATIDIGAGAISLTAPSRLKGARLYLDFPSVGATENLLMAATLAWGTSVIENAAEEPEVVDLAMYLQAMGARIHGAGTRVITVEGVDALTGAEHHVIPDRIEAGTYLVAVAAAGGEAVIAPVIPEHLKAVVAKLRETGTAVEEHGYEVWVSMRDRPAPIDVKTLPYPGFPTDMQAQMMALLSVASGTSVVAETVFENRFMHVDELNRMGARISIDGRTALIRGPARLAGAPVKATDLRAGAALIIAGLIAEGTTEVTGLNHIDRGYVDVVGKLAALGADVRRVPSQQAATESPVVTLPLCEPGRLS